MENNDKILTDFFVKNKKEIADDGFSRRVMRHLPEEKKAAHWIIPAFTMIGVAITLYFINIQEIISKMYFFVIQLPVIYIAVAFFAIPFVALAAWYINEKNYRIFG